MPNYCSCTGPKGWVVRYTSERHGTLAWGYSLLPFPGQLVPITRDFHFPNQTPHLGVLLFSNPVCVSPMLLFFLASCVVLVACHSEASCHEYGLKKEVTVWTLLLHKSLANVQSVLMWNRHFLHRLVFNVQCVFDYWHPVPSWRFSWDSHPSVLFTSSEALVSVSADFCTLILLTSRWQGCLGRFNFKNLSVISTKQHMQIFLCIN